MKIYTSYYKKVSTNTRGMLLVRISTSAPSWFPYVPIEMSELYPGWDLVNGIKTGTINWEEYTERYEAKLSNLSREIILHKLHELSELYGGKDIILLCYETPDKPCHRHLVAKWLDCGVEELQ